ncbi:MAG TPA: DUF2339 domain-containing protein [Chthoniobacterales bacterium]|nr:DUF2339 domain-containing protein [Chthoniobacterales bacterium]
MGGLILLALIVIVVVLVVPVVALAKASQALRGIEELRERLRMLEARPEAPRGGAPAEPLAIITEPPSPEPIISPVSIPPPLPLSVIAPIPKVEPAAAAEETRFEITAPSSRKIDWEQFMGAKMFAWIGGFALFLGVAFFVKYSFEHNLIPPELRVAIGFLAGIALVGGGMLLKRKENVITAQTLCATGILILYAVTFACRAFYHFPFFGLIPTFALMALITTAAFLLAVRMNALVVAILGIAGGFLTPVVLSTGQDNPLGLFGYIALLDIGLLAAARRKEWASLPILGAVGTVLMQVAWVGNFFLREQYFTGTKTLVPMGVFLAFEILFLVAAVTTNRAGKLDNAISGAALGVGTIAMCWAFYFFSFTSIGNRAGLIMSYLFLVDLGLLGLVLAKEYFNRLVAVVGLAVFVFLGLWTNDYLTAHNLSVALGAYFVFALLHSSLPIVMQRWGKATPSWSVHLFPAATLLLVLLPIFKLVTGSFLIWPLVLCVNILALLAAALTGMLATVAIVLVLTLVTLGAWILRTPPELGGLPASLLLIGGFSIFFIAGATVMSRRLGEKPGEVGNIFGGLGVPANFAIQLPTLAATLPFLLLIMATLRLPLSNPSPVFGLALLLAVLLLGITKIASLDLLACVALGSTILLEYVWHFARFQKEKADLPFLWYLGFAALFTVFPFVFHRQFARKSTVWASAALAAPLHFYLIYEVVRVTHPHSGMLGLVPAAFAIPSLICLVVLLRLIPTDSPARNAQLALFGGAALFFITLIFPIQFDRQWITLGWALEGAALCWLFHRVPHPGLRIAGIGLLLVCFARLVCNPAVLAYHPRAATPIFNWYLYTYGIVAICFFVAARLLAPPRNLVLNQNAPPLLNSCGVILAFVLLNIEIADYFTKPGAYELTFQFSGNFARDMSYSIAWALFALLLLIVGIRKRTRGARYAGLVLLCVVLLKLFFHDLSQLQQLYRIAALIVVAIIAIVASFLYQRFLNQPQKQ